MGANKYGEIQPPLQERSDAQLLEIKELAEKPISWHTISFNPSFALGLLIAAVDEILRLREELKQHDQQLS